MTPGRMGRSPSHTVSCPWWCRVVWAVVVVRDTVHDPERAWSAMTPERVQCHECTLVGRRLPVVVPCGVGRGSRARHRTCSRTGVVSRDARARAVPWKHACAGVSSVVVRRRRSLPAWANAGENQHQPDRPERHARACAGQPAHPRGVRACVCTLVQAEAATPTGVTAPWPAQARTHRSCAGCGRPVRHARACASLARARRGARPRVRLTLVQHERPVTC